MARLHEPSNAVANALADRRVFRPKGERAAGEYFAFPRRGFAVTRNIRKLLYNYIVFRVNAQAF